MKSSARHLSSLKFVTALCTATMVPTVWAADLAAIYEQAQRNDPAFQAALAEKDVNKAEAFRARMAYLPSANYRQNRTEFDTVGDRKTITVTQPVIDATRAATFLQGGPRSDFADSSFLAKKHDLAVRVLKAVNQIILTTEAITSNEKRIESFESQYKGAKRKFELGQGTITDLRDIEVKFQQAKADHLILRANKSVAEKQYRAIVGQEPPKAGFQLSDVPKALKVGSLDEIISRVTTVNPQVLSSRSNETISRLEAAKAVGALAPVLSVNNIRTEYNGIVNSYNGVSITMPFDFGSVVGGYGAHAKSAQARNQRIDTEQKTQVEAERLYQLVVAGQESVQIKKSAVDSAQLSVEANQKSFQAGVRSTTEVLNSIQVLFQVKNEYVQAVTQLSESYLNLSLIAAEDPDVSFQQLQVGLMRAGR